MNQIIKEIKNDEITENSKTIIDVLTQHYSIDSVCKIINQIKEGKNEINIPLLIVNEIKNIINK